MNRNVYKKQSRKTDKADISERLIVEAYQHKGDKCPICGKYFYSTKQWAYKRGRKKYCSYGCMRQAPLAREWRHGLSKV